MSNVIGRFILAAGVAATVGHSATAFATANTPGANARAINSTQAACLTRTVSVANYGCTSTVVVELPIPLSMAVGQVSNQVTVFSPAAGVPQCRAVIQDGKTGATTGSTPWAAGGGSPDNEVLVMGTLSTTANSVLRYECKLGQGAVLIAGTWNQV